MKLFYSPNSPYARTARAVAEETGLAPRVELVPVTLRDPASRLLPYNPVGRVPTLETDDGLVLSEAYIVCAYLDTRHDGKRLMAAAGDWTGKHAEGFVLGMLEGVVAWVRELRRAESERAPALLALEASRAARCLDRLESPAAASGLLGPEPSFARIALAAALAIADLRVTALDWRRDRPRLAAWYADYAARPAMRATAPTA